MASRGELFGGGFAMLAGLGLTVISVVDSRDDAFPSGRGVVALAGAAFFFAGLAIFWSAARKGRKPSRLQTAAGALVVIFLLAVPLSLALRSELGRSRLSAPVRFEPVQIVLEGKIIAPGDTLRIGFDPPLPVPKGYNYFISLVPPEAPVHHYGTWTYLQPSTTAAVLIAPKDEGLYELRLHPHLNAVLARETIRVIGRGGRSPPAVEKE
jgi:hypothetical protein